jgi:flagellar motor switch protein FliM
MSQSTAKAVRSHDFRRTDLLERVNLQAIGGLLETFTRSATQHLTSALRQQCTLTLEKLDQVMWRDLAEELESGTYFFTFSLAPLAGRAVLAVPIEEVLAIVDLRLAGTGEDDFSGRVPSEIDQAFLAPIVEGLLGELGKALGRIQTTTPGLEAQEGNVQFVSIASPAEMCMAARFSLTVANRPARPALICLPFPMVRMLIDSLQSRTALGDEQRQESFADGTRRRLAEIPVNAVFQFPSFVTTPAELLTLRVGDSLGLGHPKGRFLEVRVEGLLVALAEICSSGVHKACEIKEEVTK